MLTKINSDKHRELKLSQRAETRILRLLGHKFKF